MKNKYKKFIIIYYALLASLIIFCTSYVYLMLVEYESNQPEVYIKNLAKDIQKNPVKYGEVKTEHSKGYTDYLKNNKITVKEKDDLYQIIAGDKALFNVELKEGKKITKLKILSYNILSVKEIKPLSENGVYFYTVEIPSTFTLKVDGKDYAEPKEEAINEIFEDIEHELYPKNYIYELTNLIKEPVIEIYNNRNELVEYKKEDNIIYSNEFYKTDDYENEIIENFDVLEFAKKWSLNLTKDLSGRSGFNILKPNLLEGNKMYKLAYNWSKGEDFGMVSAHTLANPTFTNTSVSDCYIYSDKAFSCLVKLEKNLIIGMAKRPQVDKLNDRFFFLYDNGWRFVDLHFVGE